MGPNPLSAALPPAPASRPDSLSSPRISLSRGQTLAALVDDIERDLIRDSLARHRGNISETARVLGLTRRGLYLKLRRLGLDEPSEMVSK